MTIVSRMKTILTFLLLFVRPPDEATHACTDLAGENVYLVESPDECYVGDKFVCDVGSFGIGTRVCCAWDWSTCTLVDPPEQCLAVEMEVCSA